MDDYQIEIANQQQFLRLDEGFLHQMTVETLRAEGVVAAEISIALVDHPTIWELNRTYLNHDYPTDVLSFLLDRSDDGAPDLSARQGRGNQCTLSGEVIIGVEMALQVANEYDISPSEEVALYLVHGLLHLCGFDDLTETEREIMRAREREILRIWRISPRESLQPPGPSSAAPVASSPPSKNAAGAS